MQRTPKILAKMHACCTHGTDSTIIWYALLTNDITVLSRCHKAMLHEAIFLATRIATNVALQVARKNSRVTPHFATAIVALRVARKVKRPSTFRNVARQVACVWHPLCNSQRNFVRMGQSELIFRRLSASAILFVIVRVASFERSCQRVTYPLQLERFFIRHRCVASRKKNCLL